MRLKDGVHNVLFAEYRQDTPMLTLLTSFRHLYNDILNHSYALSVPKEFNSEENVRSNFK